MSAVCPRCQTAPLTLRNQKHCARCMPLHRRDYWRNWSRDKRAGKKTKGRPPRKPCVECGGKRETSRTKLCKACWTARTAKWGGSVSEKRLELQAQAYDSAGSRDGMPWTLLEEALVIALSRFGTAVEVSEWIGRPHSSVVRKAAAFGVACRVPWQVSDSELDRLRAMWAAGESHIEIGAELGWNKARVARMAKRLGLPDRPQGMDAETAAQVVSLRLRHGWSYGKIAAHVGVSYSAVAGQIWRHLHGGGSVAVQSAVAEQIGAGHEHA